MKLTVKQLRRIIREEITRPRHKNSTRLNELFGFGEKSFYTIKIVYKLKSEELFGRAKEEADRYKGAFADPIIRDARPDPEAWKDVKMEVKNDVLVVTSTTTPVTVEKNVNDQISKSVKALKGAAESNLKSINDEVTKRKLDFQGVFEFVVSFSDKGGKSIDPPKGFDANSADVKLSK